MSDVGFSDQNAFSPSRRFMLEAQSPNNGKINGPDDQPADPNSHISLNRVWQSNFRYRLIETASSRILWERWQKPDEPSPSQILLSDNGWTVLQLHSFIPQIIVISPDGRDVVTLCVTSRKDPLCKRYILPDPHPPLWVADHLSDTSAGVFFTAASWPCFLSDAAKPIFSWRMLTGQRLIIDLENAYVIPDDLQAQNQDLLDACERQESQEVYETLKFLTSNMEETIAAHFGSNPDISPQVQETALSLRPAIELAGRLKLRHAVPLLRQWQERELPSSFTFSRSRGYGSLESQLLRPLLHQALARLNEPSSAFPCYNFINARHDRMPFPDHVTHRSTHAATLAPGMRAKKALLKIGSPDYIGDTWSHAENRRLNHWEYDFYENLTWTTLRLDLDGHSPDATIKSIERLPAPWQTDSYRTRDFFPH